MGASGWRNLKVRAGGCARSLQDPSTSICASLDIRVSLASLDRYGRRVELLSPNHPAGHNPVRLVNQRGQVESGN